MAVIEFGGGKVSLETYKEKESFIESYGMRILAQNNDSDTRMSELVFNGMVLAGASSCAREILIDRGVSYCIKAILYGVDIGDVVDPHVLPWCWHVARSTPKGDTQASHCLFIQGELVASFDIRTGEIRCWTDNKNAKEKVERVVNKYIVYHNSKRTYGLSDPVANLVLFNRRY